MRMLPAMTASLPNFFTPRRLLTLSRPLRTLPWPFLCAIVVLQLDLDAGDLHAAELLPVADRTVVAFAAAILIGDDLLRLDLVDQLEADGRAAEERVANRNLVAVA